MALLAIVLFFVILTLVAFFLAMSGGPKGARERMRTQTRRGGNGATVLFLIVLAVLGIGVPVAVIASDKGPTSNPEAGVVELTALQEHGQELFGRNCRNCHTLAAANAYATIGPSLDERRPPKALVLNAIEEGRAAGNGNMAADLVEGEDAEAVAQFVAVATGNPPE